MASPTDLPGVLRNDSNNLRGKVHEVWTRFDGTGTDFCFNVKFTPIGASTPEKLNKEGPIVVRAAIPGIDALLDLLEELIVKALGQTPIGGLYIQGYSKGKSATPEIEMWATLKHGSMGLGDPSAAFLQSMWQSAERRAAAAEARQAEMHGATMQTLGTFATTIANLGTVRAATAAGAEISGLWSLAALAMIVLAAPTIKQAMGLPQDAPLSLVGAAGKEAINASLQGKL